MDKTRIILSFLIIILTHCKTSNNNTPLTNNRNIQLPEYSSEWLKHWNDGKAELNEYKHIQKRYGEFRKGKTQALFVTEPFDSIKNVKPNNYSNQAQVMKLNLIEDFNTGVYDYNLMTSVFYYIQKGEQFPENHFAKVNFSSQEWCGHSFYEFIFKQNKVQLTANSYFEDESIHESYPISESVLPSDFQFFYVRNIIAPGKYNQSLQRLKNLGLKHQRVSKENLTIKKLTHVAFKKMISNISFEHFFKYSFKENSQYYIFEHSNTFDFYEVENVFPFKILSFGNSEGDLAILEKSKRLPYWELNKNGDEGAF